MSAFTSANGTFRTSHGIGDESAMWGKADIGALLAIPRLWRAGLTARTGAVLWAVAGSSGQ